ncbi:hypothetical protein TIFTF001_008076 [Ficus carica]|uniref:Uncharacterized protein n=1 Tax=Ficus carica TaxID=3494 RepID=A0AA88DGU7_FICCA|nr:hypothetical protein TIFTF001_008076 [Ficus carica]
MPRLSRFSTDQAIKGCRLCELFSPVTRVASSPRSDFSLFAMSSTTISPWCRDSDIASLYPRLWLAAMMVERREERNR